MVYQEHLSYDSITSSHERWNLGVFCMQLEGFPWFCKRHREPSSWREENCSSSFYPDSPDCGFQLCIFCCSYYIFIHSGVEITTLNCSFSGTKHSHSFPKISRAACKYLIYPEISQGLVPSEILLTEAHPFFILQRASGVYSWFTKKPGK